MAPALGRSVTQECARGQYAFPRYHKVASYRHAQQYLSVVTRALDAVARHALSWLILTPFRPHRVSDRPPASKLIHPIHIRWPTPTLRHSLLAYW